MTIYYNNRFALKCAFLASRIMTLYPGTNLFSAFL